MAQSNETGNLTFCTTCGYEIKWRTIDGKRTPMGCRCDYGEHGLSQFFRDRAMSTTCPKCRERVYFVRHNGGSVWFDQLGEPWWKHACFGGDLPKSAILAPKWVSLTKIETTDLGQQIMFVSHGDESWELYPAPEFWTIEPQPKKGDTFSLDWKNETLEFKGSPRCRFWEVISFRCPHCEKHYLDHQFHKNFCRERVNSR
jgi:hypothetical protein